MRAADTRLSLQLIAGVAIVPVQSQVHPIMLNQMRESVTEYLRRESVRGVVFDMTGVEVMDRDDFEGLRMVVDCVTLMGAAVVLAGIRPGVAAGLTALDVDHSWVRATRTVDQAIALLQ